MCPQIFAPMSYSSKRFEEAIHELSKFPGIGKKSATRMALFLLKKSEAEVEKLSDSILQLKKQTRYCSKCRNLCEDEICAICSNARRNASLVCVVEDVRDVIAIENTGQYSGLYHVLGGLISPVNGIGPADLPIDLLCERIAHQGVEEIILALSATPEGDTTAFYLSKKMSAYPHVKMSSISRGIAIGGDLEFADEITLGRSITGRVPYSVS